MYLRNGCKEESIHSLLLHSPNSHTVWGRAGAGARREELNPGSAHGWQESSHWAISAAFWGAFQQQAAVRNLSWVSRPGTVVGWRHPSWHPRC